MDKNDLCMHILCVIYSTLYVKLFNFMDGHLVKKNSQYNWIVKGSSYKRANYPRVTPYYIMSVPVRVRAGHSVSLKPFFEDENLALSLGIMNTQNWIDGVNPL